ncbi:hypothetical protein [Bacteroides sp. 519]|uniref:hypothetical protein n=1 Tax=Bacteroides sp. 519 TaxID=2302937 RepID=UPI0013D824CF|nr:hypothetical protein [Bacteroides sp. 519]
MDSIKSYKAFVYTDTIGADKIYEFAYNTKNDTLKYQETYLFKKESWGISRIINSIANPFLRIDTHEAVYWVYPDELFEDIRSTSYIYIGKDSILNKSINNKVLAYQFQSEDGDPYGKKILFLDEDFNLVSMIIDYYYYLDNMSSKLEVVDPVDVPSKFRMLIDNIIICLE